MLYCPQASCVSAALDAGRSIMVKVKDHIYGSHAAAHKYSCLVCGTPKPNATARCYSCSPLCEHTQHNKNCVSCVAKRKAADRHNRLLKSADSSSTPATHANEKRKHRYLTSASPSVKSKPSKTGLNPPERMAKIDLKLLTMMF